MIIHSFDLKEKKYDGVACKVSMHPEEAYPCNFVIDKNETRLAFLGNRIYTKDDKGGSIYFIDLDTFVHRK